MNPLAHLLADRDRWDGAACVGEWDLFDPPGEREPEDLYSLRVEYARAICTTCPILVSCHEYASNARPRDRAGIWAGVPYDHRGRPVKEAK